MKRRISVLIVAFVLFAIPAWAIYQSSTFGNRSGAAAGTAEYTVYITENTTDFNGITYSGLTVYTGVIENHLKESEPTVNYGTSTTIEVSDYDSGDYTRSLIKFPTSSIPATATVTSVEFGMYCTSAAAGTRTMQIHNLLRAWVEAESTWNIYSTGNSWSTAGAGGSGTDIAATAASTGQTMPAATAWGTWNHSGLVSLVQDWIDGTTANNGVRLERDDGVDDFAYNIFSSSEATDGQRPYLKIVYQD